MKIGRFVTQFQYSMTALLLITAFPWHVSAQNSNAHALTPQHQHPVLNLQSKGALLKVVRDSTERFKDVSVAEAEGYALMFGCVSGSDFGAMGLHYVNGDLVNKGVIDATLPQIIIYEPTPSGRLRLIGADYLVLADAWDKGHPGEPPQLMGQLFHLFEPQSLRTSGVLHATCLGMEGESQRRVRELASKRFVPGVQRPKPLS